MPPTALDDAVKTAVTTEITQPATEPKTETKVEAPPQETAEQIKTRDALRLYEALEDPTIGPGVIKELAKRAGIAASEDKITPTAAVKTVVDVLKENLGEDYGFLADKLANGIQTIVNQIFDERIKPIQGMTESAIERAVVRETDASFAKFHSQYKDAKDFDKEMTELSKKMPYDGSYPMEEYLGNLYKIVTSDRKEAKTVEKTVNKINQNAKELRDSSTEVTETRVTKGSKLPSLNESIAAAFRGERLV